MISNNRHFPNILPNLRQHPLLQETPPLSTENMRISVNMFSPNAPSFGYSGTVPVPVVYSPRLQIVPLFCSVCNIIVRTIDQGHPKTLRSDSFLSNSHVSATFSILLRFGEFLESENCAKFNDDGSLMGRTNLDTSV